MSASSSAYHLRVRDLVEALQREDQDDYVNVVTRHDNDGQLFTETEPLTHIDRQRGCRRYVELRGDY